MIILITIISHQLGCALQLKWCCVSSGFPDYQKKKKKSGTPRFPRKPTEFVCVCASSSSSSVYPFFQEPNKMMKNQLEPPPSKKKKVGVVMPPPGPPPSKKKCGSEDTCVHRTFTHKHTDSHSEPSKKKKKEREREKKRARFLFVFYLIFWTFVLRPTNARGRKKNATLPLEGRQLAGLARALERERERGTVSERRGEDQWGSECKSIN